MGLLGGVLGLRSDPVLAHNFLISLIDTSSSLAMATSLATAAVSDVASGGFSECTGLEVSQDIKDYEEGGNNAAVLKFPGRIKWANITLKRGVGTGTALWDWHYGFVEGRGKRRDGVIVLLNDLHLPHNIWYFRRGLPLKYTGPAMNAGQNNVAIEAIEIAHEGLFQLPGVGLAASVGASAARELWRLKMDVHIGEIVSTVHAVDGEALLAPRTLEKIVAAVLRAVDEREAHGRRVKAEQRVTSGVRGEMAGED